MTPRDDTRTWQQANIAFPAWQQAEHTAVTHLAPLLRSIEDEGALDGWFFIRKRPCWRLRYQPAAGGDATARLERHLDLLRAERRIEGWCRVVYEPEAHAFGGAAGMAIAHRLFHRDSRSLLDYLARDGRDNGGHRRELSLMLCSILMRAAAQDWYEQGDIWARVADHRTTTAPVDVPATLPAAVHRLISVDAEGLMRQGAPLAHAAAWAEAYAAAGGELAELAAAGALHRGLRAILAHHVIFAWNRLGLPYAAQHLLASTARHAVFGPDPTFHRDEGGPCPAHQHP